MNTPEIKPLSKADEFSELLRCYGDMAYRMACQITCGRESEARDLVQDGFIKIWRYWQIQRPTSFKGWMYRLLHNLYMDVLRRKARRPTVSLDGQTDDGTPWEKQLSNHEPDLSSDLERQELRMDVTQALYQLDLEFRLPVILCDMEGLSYDEIAQVMSCPVGTVRSRIHRGRVQLRALLGHHRYQPEIVPGRIV
jgi:RNA polymerase sigma-70 factor (ECF subfamily)